MSCARVVPGRIGSAVRVLGGPGGVPTTDFHCRRSLAADDPPAKRCSEILGSTNSGVPGVPFAGAGVGLRLMINAKVLNGGWQPDTHKSALIMSALVAEVSP